MKAIIQSLLLETKIGLIRNLLFVVISALLVFFEAFTDFPFSPHAQAQEYTSKDEQLLDILIYWILFLAIFRQCVLRDLDSRIYFAQHPLNYKSHFIGKCIFLCLIFVLVDLLVFAVRGFCGFYYSYSLGAFTLNTYTDRLVADIAGSLFSGGFILLISLFRPLHFALLIVIVIGAFVLVDAQPNSASYVPLFAESFRPSLFWAPVPWLLGMYLYEWKMTRTPVAIVGFVLQRYPRLQKLHLTKIVPVLITSGCLGFAIYLNWPEQKLSPIQKVRQELLGAIRQLRHQDSTETNYFSFKFQQEHQWIADELTPFADQEWQHLHKEFGIPFKEKPRVEVFIKPSDEHTLGSTRGTFIIINSATTHSADDQGENLKKTFRHELTHVIINRLSDFQFIENADILGGFFHEGLAELAEHNWNTDDPVLLGEAALHYKAYDEGLMSLLPKLSQFSDYDYDVNYGLGYVFWGEFVKIYGRGKVKDFLYAVGDIDAQDGEYKGIQFLFHQANLAKIDLYKVFQASELTMANVLKGLDPQLLAQVQALKHFKATRFETDKILIPYLFESPAHALCKFRQNDSLHTQTERIVKWSYQGNTGGLCNLPKHNGDELQLLIYFDSGIVFRSRWIKMPKI
ncbi:hypothetical protein [Methylovulum psychrotolerans]|uniref:Uncharacterized protein n=1 Tax=Methylovulum psychrotolerans TaxID=1704499 RepID=A0A2S5CHC5_9GAMM|nr:hypothetical protein [Methylovulum psychrotolerans]POZ50132.1 hypothetical protein AADEFJLK_04029 [Methylovulum psychrotolerans]